MNTVSFVRIIFISLWTVYISLIAGFFLLLGGKKNGPRFYQSFNLLWARIILEFCGIEVEVKGLEKIKNLCGAILVSNHMSYFDILIIAPVLKIAFRFVFKAELLRVPIFGWILGKSGNIPINREHSSISTIRRIKKTLEKGINVIMFAEGTSGYENEILPFKRGPFILASQLKASIIPIVIRGSYFVYNKQKRRQINSGKVTVEFFDPVLDFLDKKFMSKEEKIETILKVKEKVRDIIVSKYLEVKWKSK